MEALANLCKEIIGIIIGLGVNETVYYQLAIFPIGYFCLYFFVFKPYFRLFQEREKSTLGTQDLAGQIIKETEDLEAKYQVKARQVSEQYKEVYDKYKAEAMHEYNQVVNQARNQAKDLVDKAKEEIGQNAFVARKQLLDERPQVVNAIVTQVLGGRE